MRFFDIRDEIQEAPVSTESIENERGEITQMKGRDSDRASEFLTTAHQYNSLTPAQERKLKHKLDRWMIPMLLFTATLGAVDKVTLGTASLYGFQKDENLHGQQYSWLGSILSLGALFGMFPNTYLISGLPSAKFMCICSIVWSGMALLLAACTNWSELMAVRFLMGTAECVIIPSVTLIVSRFYTKVEQAPRNAWVFGSWSSLINGFLAWAIGHVPNDAPLHIWQYLFLITASVSMAWSIFVFFMLPGTPMEARFLTEEEKYHVLVRVAENHTGVESRIWKWDQVLEAVVDPKTWILFFFDIAINIPNGGLQTFGSIIIKDLGFDSLNASLLSMPTGIMSTAASVIFSYAAARWHNRRALVTMIACCVPIIGTALIHGLPRDNLPGRMVGLYLLYTYFGPYYVAISLAQANTAGNTKKVVVFGILYVGYSIGNLIGPQTFRTSQAPEYVGGVIAMIVCYCVCVGLAGLYWVVTVAANKRKQSGDVPRRESPQGFDGLMDLSDFKRPGFRYIT
ncbi:hypothetical protein AAFC00_001930 [Neodothiora populina]|uniref:Allantoate permease n=1 Tax=Neodothiora populina TaxID=2781224 RepID=A0ABR3PQM7_9PEZI